MATIVGYHGCERAFADGVRSGRITIVDWRQSQNAFDWLGEGIYFWEGSRSRAERWSAERFGANGDVLCAEIELGVCLDLLENVHHEGLRETYRELRSIFHRKGIALPKNRKKLHDLDNLVINNFAEVMGEQGVYFQTVRGVFEEGPRIFPGSAIRSESHIQVAVRDFRCIHVLDRQGAWQ